MDLLNTSETALYAVDDVGNLLYIHSVMPELLLDAARTVCNGGNTFVHLLTSRYKTRSFGGFDETLLRLVLRMVPANAIAENDNGQTPYDLLDPNKPYLFIARRLLLLAGAPSLHPETRKQLNYEARKGALLAFFGATGRGDSRERMNICSRIRHGAGAMELIRQIVSFL